MDIEVSENKDIIAIKTEDLLENFGGQDEDDNQDCEIWSSEVAPKKQFRSASTEQFDKYIPQKPCTYSPFFVTKFSVTPTTF